MTKTLKIAAQHSRAVTLQADGVRPLISNQKGAVRAAALPPFDWVDHWLLKLKVWKVGCMPSCNTCYKSETNKHDIHR